jgi:hypothetical protein
VSLPAARAAAANTNASETLGALRKFICPILPSELILPRILAVTEVIRSKKSGPVSKAHGFTWIPNCKDCNPAAVGMKHWAKDQAVNYYGIAEQVE